MLDPEKIPSSSARDLAVLLLRETKRAMADPTTKKAYEEWAKERREKGNG